MSPFCQCFVHPVHLARHELPPLLKYNVLIDQDMLLAFFRSLLETIRISHLLHPTPPFAVSNSPDVKAKIRSL
jgi:hypothetical protein